MARAVVGLEQLLRSGWLLRVGEDRVVREGHFEAALALRAVRQIIKELEFHQQLRPLVAVARHELGLCLCVRIVDQVVDGVLDVVLLLHLWDHGHLFRVFLALSPLDVLDGCWRGAGHALEYDSEGPEGVLVAPHVIRRRQNARPQSVALADHLRRVLVHLATLLRAFHGLASLGLVLLGRLVPVVGGSLHFDDGAVVTEEGRRLARAVLLRLHQPTKLGIAPL
mmetsp:Transcript_27837/g.64897  ORF Transcript_27837/g.64897 Transcript_27837/m.64897 type:complete len:224 (-) Transcript_27837:170-841(-)